MSGTTRARRNAGAGAAPLPLDATLAESRYCADAGNSMTPDRLYDRQWAMTLLDRALGPGLRAEHQRVGKAA